MATRIFLIAGLLIVLLGTGCAPRSFNAAPVYQREVQPPVTMRRGLGPVYENSDRFDTQHVLALRPFYSHAIDETRDYTARDVLWPFYMYREYPQSSTHLGLAGLFRRRTRDDGAVSMWLLPIWFQGQTAEEEGYFALFPLGGNLKDFAGYDAIWFWLFPLYLGTEKLGAESDTLLWPVLSRTDGPKVEKRRVFPFYGYAEHTGGWRRDFVLWPIVHWGKPLAPGSQGSSLFVLPLGGYINYTNDVTGAQLKNRTVLWPFFSFLWTGEGHRYHCPWPFVRLQRDFPEQGDSRTWLWPFWGTDHERGRDSWFALWPLIRYQHEQQTSRGEAEQFYVLPFWWDFRYQQEARPDTRYRRLWPLASLDQQGDHYTRFRSLDLWPIRQHEVIDRNFAPFWTLYEYQRQENRRQHDVLWGLWQYQKAEHLERCSLFPLFSYRHTPDGNRRTLNLLTGLFGRERVEDETYTRLLWFLRF